MLRSPFSSSLSHHSLIDAVARDVLPGDEGLCRRDRPRAQPLEFLQDDLRLRGESESLPGHPIQTDCVAAFLVTRSGQSIEIGIRRRVGGLPGDTEHRSGRGNEEEEVEAARREGLVQHLCAGDFRPHRAPKTTLLGLGEELAFGQSGGVYDTAYRGRTVIVAPGEQGLYRAARSDIESHGIDGDATPL
jgi:hypothetical protein